MKDVQRFTCCDDAGAGRRQWDHTRTNRGRRKEGGSWRCDRREGEENDGSAVHSAWWLIKKGSLACLLCYSLAAAGGLRFLLDGSVARCGRKSADRGRKVEAVLGSAVSKRSLCLSDSGSPVAAQWSDSSEAVLIHRPRWADEEEGVSRCLWEGSISIVNRLHEVLKKCCV
jgi:hypothetical protein